MRKGILLLTSFVALVIVVYSGCRRDPIIVDIPASKYPEAIGKIVLTKCAIPGCHNTQSKEAAAGLDLSSWDKMMEGDRNGAVCIPYSHDYSTLFLFTNTYSELGPIVRPTMPIGGDSLSIQEVRTLRDWIDAGAPNADGFVKWSDDPHRKKYYVACQGCDAVCTIDAKTNLQMRYIPVGADANIESPHIIKLSPDGEYWYCSFIAGRYIEKHRTSDDALVGRALLGANQTDAVGSWNTLSITPDGKYAMVVDWSFNGRVALVNLETMQWRRTWQGQGYFVQPHGSAVQVRNDTTFFIATASYGNYIYRMDTLQFPYPNSVNFPDQYQIPVDGTALPANDSSSSGIHDIAFSPDGTKYYCTGQKSNKVYVMTSDDHYVTTIPVGGYPQEFAVSNDPTTPYLYVTCMEDLNTYPGNRGSVYVINMNTNTVVATVNTGYQPHGLTVNDDDHVVLVANRNAFPGGPAPHHSTSCLGTNGYFTLIDMNTNTLIPGSKTELIVDPYSAVYRR